MSSRGKKKGIQVIRKYMLRKITDDTRNHRVEDMCIY